MNENRKVFHIKVFQMPSPTASLSSLLQSPTASLGLLNIVKIVFSCVFSLVQCILSVAPAQ